MCFSWDFIKQVLILAVVIVAIIGILQLIVPYIIRRLGVTLGEGWNVIVGAFRVFPRILPKLDCSIRLYLGECRGRILEVVNDESVIGHDGDGAFLHESLEVLDVLPAVKLD